LLGEEGGGAGRGSKNSASSSSVPTLPQSYLMLHATDGGDCKNDTVRGHGRLTDCFEGAGGSAAALTYILAEPKGQGYGTLLMTLLEDEAAKLGYHYVYLWTTTAVPFYEKLGYKQTERVSLYSACLKKLECAQVSQLEAMLHKKMGNANVKRKETVLLPPDAVTQNDVWMRKRLVESVGSEMITVDERMNEIKAIVKSESKKETKLWKYVLLEIPWQQQVGPSCGLAALRMLRDHYVVIDDDATRMPSLLTEAQQKGYTVDGEIFDATNMMQLASFCGLKAELRSLHQTSPTHVLSILQQGGTLIIPYDSQPLTKRPHCDHGKTAHYGIIVGIMFGFLDANGSDYCFEPMTQQPHDGNCSVEEAAECWLLVQHRLSRKLSIASWSSFYDSNQQLTVVDSKKYQVDRLNLRDCVIVCHGAM